MVDVYSCQVKFASIPYSHICMAIPYLTAIRIKGMMPFLYQAERTRSEEHLASQVQERDTQLHQTEAELKQARIQIQQKSTELSSVQQNCEV